MIELIRQEDNSLFMERETGITHSAFEREYELFNTIKNGDVEGIKKKAMAYLSEGITMGNLSENELRQYRYWAVCTIAVAIHYAILGGMDETDAFNLSDEYIRHIDSMSSMEEILNYLTNKATDLTYGVFNAKACLASSPAIKRCVHYIHVHLHEKITTENLANVCNISRSYLSVLFKKELGISIHDYILKEKMNAARVYLSDGVSFSEIAYRLSFCSESHFISSYKKYYGITPGKEGILYQSEPQSEDPESQSEPEFQS